MQLSHALNNYEHSVDQAVPLSSEFELHNLSSIAVRPNEWVELIELELFDAPNVQEHEITDYQQFLTMAMTPLAKQEIESAFEISRHTDVDANSERGNRNLASLAFALNKLDALDVQQIRADNFAPLDNLVIKPVKEAKSQVAPNNSHQFDDAPALDETTIKHKM